MIWEPAKPPDPETIEDAHRLAGAGADRETILFFLRERGFDKIDSIKTVREIYGLSMPDAKELVDHGAAWSDRYDSDMQFRETVLRILRGIAASNANDPNAPKITFVDRKRAEEDGE
jgi:Ribosomal protein L7/L12 C-terminal domain